MLLPSQQRFNVLENRLRIGPDLVDAPAFLTLLAALGLDEFVITDPRIVDGEGEDFSITGKSAVLGTTLDDLTLSFFIVDNSYTFELTGSLARLRLQMLARRAIVQFVDAGSMAPLLDLEFMGVDLSFSSEDAALFFGTLKSPHSPEAFNNLGLSIEQVGFECFRSYTAGDSLFVLRPTIRLGKTTLNALIEIPVRGPNPALNWKISLLSAVRLDTGLHDVFDFLLKLPFVPPELKGSLPDTLFELGALYLKSLYFVVDPRTMRFLMVDLEVGSADPFYLPDTTFTIERIGVGVTAALQGDSTVLTLRLNGGIQVDDFLHLGVRIEVPTDSVTPWHALIQGQATLQGFTQLPANLLPGTTLEEFHLPTSLLDVQSLNLERFALTFSPKIGIERVELVLSTELTCTLAPMLALENPGLKLYVVNPFNSEPAKVTAGERSLQEAAISGLIRIDTLLFAVSAQKKPDGWRFSGALRGNLNLGKAFAAIARHFQADMPAALEDFTLTSLSVEFSTSTNAQAQQALSLLFLCAGRIKLGQTELISTLVVRVSRQGEKYNCEVRADFELATMTFSANLSATNEGIGLVAGYKRQEGALPLTLGSLSRAITPDAAQIASELDRVTIDLKDALFAYKKTSDTLDKPARTVMVVGLDIGANLSLSKLPLVGKEFPAGQSASVENLRLLVASADLRQVELNAINGLLPAGIAPIAAAASEAQPGGDQSITVPPQDAIVLFKGVTIAAQINLGGTSKALALPTGKSGGAAAGTTGTPGTSGAAGTTPPTTTTATAGAPAVDGAKWFTLQKKLGPLELQRVGVMYKDAVLWFLLDAALSAGGLSLSLEGLGLGSPLTRFDPQFSLRGLGVDYRSEAVEIAGAFLRTTQPEGKGGTYDQYAGAAVVKAKELTLSALGAYATVEGHPSLFVYALLDYPIGGPAFFFVTGLAGGFGYNRALRIPPVEGVAQFPLVKMAMEGAEPEAPQQKTPTLEPAVPGAPAARENPADRVLNVLTSLSAYVPPSTGDIFLAVGIKFTSFKIIDSFALLTIAFGHRFELNVLGLSKLVVPPQLPGGSAAPVEPLAEIKMALKASFIPDEGFLGVSAQLASNSYLLARACQITGGFAFYSWFDGPHKGDFVLTLGGYHPAYKAPAHYPRVPRLEINWQIEPRLSVKGQAYFALTASALMAGGVLEATYDDGSLKAWFRLGADFIISWKPYYYDARVYLNMGVSYSFEFAGTQRIDIDVGAQLHIWGPEFAGTAAVDLGIVEVEVEFGPSRRPAKLPILWDEFQTSFLPRAAGQSQPQCCGLAVTAGLLRKVGEDGADLGIVNAKELVFVANTLIPATGAEIRRPLAVQELYFDGGGEDARPLPFQADEQGPFTQQATAHRRRTGAVGIAPMAVRTIGSVLTLTITYMPDPQASPVNVEGKFSYTPVLKQVPTALWGDSLSPGLGTSQFVKDALSGFEIRPANDGLPPDVVSAKSWQFDSHKKVDGAFRWESGQTPAAPQASEQASLHAMVAELMEGRL